MPERCAGVRFIIESTPLRGGDVAPLPVAHTCFFQIDLPRYTSKEVLKESEDKRQVKILLSRNPATMRRTTRRATRSALSA